MIHFFQPFILQLNPGGINASIDYFYKHCHQNVPLAFNRATNLYETVDIAKAFSPVGHRQVLAIVKYSMSCVDLKQWLMARKNIVPYAVDFYKLENDGVTITLIGTKVLAPQRG